MAKGDALKRAAAAIDALRAERARLVARLAEIDGVLGGAGGARRPSANGGARGRISGIIRASVAGASSGVPLAEIIAAVRRELPAAERSNIAAQVTIMYARRHLRRTGARGAYRYYAPEGDVPETVQ